jgi:putative transposase
MIDKDHPVFSVSRQCSLLGLHRSGLYYKPSLESEENLEILRKLDEQYLQTPFFGARRLKAWLLRQGYQINRKRMRRLMEVWGWQTIYRRPRTTIPQPGVYKYPYLLKDLLINRVNQVWAMDITFVPMRRGYMYLCAIIDVHSRYVVNWSVSNTMTAAWCCQVVEEALEMYGIPEIFNTDQGSQFTSVEFTSLLESMGIQISMDGKGRAIDNIFIERLWKSVKYEHIYLHVYDDAVQLYEGLKGYFQFYNQQRPHQGLAYDTPEEFYRRSAA